MISMEDEEEDEVEEERRCLLGLMSSSTQKGSSGSLRSDQSMGSDLKAYFFGTSGTANFLPESRESILVTLPSLDIDFQFKFWLMVLKILVDFRRNFAETRETRS